MIRVFGRLLVAVFCVIAVVTSPASAGLITYPDQPSWLAGIAAQGLGSVTVTIPEPSSSLGYDLIGAGDASVTYSGVSFSQSATLSDGNFYNVGSSFSSYPPVVSSQQQTVGVANITIVFPFAVHAFSLNYGTLFGSDVTFTLSNGEAFTQPSAGGGYDVPEFAGAFDSTAFTSVLITSDDDLNLNNVSYAIVPEPGTLVLAALGLTCLGVKCRRRKSPGSARN